MVKKAPAKTKAKKAAPPADPGEPRIEYVELSELRRWPGNPKEHDLDALGEAMEVNGYVTPVIVDEGTGQLVEGHGRLDKLTRLRESGAPPPERIRVEGGRWLVPVVRGMNLKEPDKHLLAANRLVELGGYDNRALAAMLSRYGEDEAALFGTGFGADDYVKFMVLAKEPQSPAAFPSVGGDLPTDFCCPRCHYQWSGDPQAGRTAPEPAEEDGA